MTILYDERFEGCHTVVTRSTSTYRTELSFCQQITSLSSKVAVSMELSDFKRVCSIDDPRKLRLILLFEKYREYYNKILIFPYNFIDIPI